MFVICFLVHFLFVCCCYCWIYLFVCLFVGLFLFCLLFLFCCCCFLECWFFGFLWDIIFFIQLNIFTFTTLRLHQQVQCNFQHKTYLKSQYDTGIPWWYICDSVSKISFKFRHDFLHLRPLSFVTDPIGFTMPFLYGITCYCSLSLYAHLLRYRCKLEKHTTLDDHS